MIQFRIDGRSGVAPYLQIVQQVRHALRLGLLQEGDQLPTVKEVVAQVAINPNTVLKAYPALEHEGLATGRRGVGTFVTKSLIDTPLAAQAAIATRPGALARKSTAARPRRRQHPRAVRGHLSGADSRGRRVTNIIETSQLGKRYRRRWALQDCTVSIPQGRVVGLVGANGAGKTTLMHLMVGLLRPSAGALTVLGGRPADGTEPVGSSRFPGAGRAFVRDSQCRRPPSIRWPLKPGLGRGCGVEPR